jgi:hypothetical protein
VTRQELRIFLDGWYCECGDPERASQELLNLLRMHPLHQGGGWDKLEDRLGLGFAYLLLYTLDHFDLTELAGVINGGWLTEKGEAVRDALAREEADEFEALLAGHCSAGRDEDDPGHLVDAPENEQCPCRKGLR